jgi:uncharacterized protein (UPF0333 family)
MRSTFVKGIVIQLVLAVVIAAGYFGYRSAKNAYITYKGAQQTALYLYSPTAVKGAKGEALTRADIIDAALRKFVVYETEAAKQAPKAPTAQAPVAPTSK